MSWIMHACVRTRAHVCVCVCVCACARARARAALLQLSPTLCNPVGCSPPGSCAHGILQARVVEWVAISSCRVSSQPRHRTHVSYVSCIGSWVFLFVCLFSLPLVLPGKPILDYSLH